MSFVLGTDLFCEVLKMPLFGDDWSFFQQLNCANRVDDDCQ